MHEFGILVALASNLTKLLRDLWRFFRWAASKPWKAANKLLPFTVSIQRKGKSTAVSPNRQAAAASPTKPWWEEHTGLFFESTIDRVIFADLWDAQSNPSPEPKLVFLCAVRNTTNESVVINGVEGAAVIDDVECNQLAKFQGGSRVPALSRSQGIGEITQPLSLATAAKLLASIEKGEVIRFSLASLQLKGIIEGVGVDLPRVSAAGAFEVDGTGIARQYGHANVDVQPIRLASRPARSR